MSSQIPDAGDFLESVDRYANDPDAPKSAADRPPKLATIDPAYSTGKPRVTFDGESVLGARTYPFVSSYTPVAGQRVLMQPVGHSYVILGALTESAGDSSGNWVARPSLGSGSNWNTAAVLSGTYAVNQLGTNAPAGAYAWGVLTVARSLDSGIVSQTYVTHSDPIQVWVRVKYGADSTWKPWARLAMAAEIPSPHLTGEVKIWPGASIPAGFVECNFQELSRVTYAALYAALGGAASPWGQGNGTTTFNAPDFRGDVIAGRDTGDATFDTMGKAFGAKTAAHAHNLSSLGWAQIIVGTGVGAGTNTVAGKHKTLDAAQHWTATFRTSPGSVISSSLSSEFGTTLDGATDSASPSTLQPGRVAVYIIKT